ncbi:MAG: toprim domain-containing protein [Methylococcus sp.]|nr:toprim domain-containing protein [Methylococcus sp.]
MLKKARPAATDHPYLLAKRVGAYGIYQLRDQLVIPMRDTSRAVSSLQFISADGSKRFLTGGEVAGRYYAIGVPAGTICIVEGYATGASVFQATGLAVAVAFNAGNLKPVAASIRAQFPEARIMVCADNDQFTKGNPGITAGRAAAEAVGGFLAFPQFQGNELDERPTDFNDLHRLRGLEAVKWSINAAQEIEAEGDHESIPDEPAAESEPPDEDGTDDPAIPPPPEGHIALVAHRLPHIIHELNKVLLHSGAELFERSGSLVHVFRTEKLRKLQGAAHLPEGTLVIEAVSPELLRLIATREAKFTKYDSRMSRWKRTDCPLQIASTFLAANGIRQIRPLRGSASSPVLRPDGSVLDQQGYDHETGLYLSWSLGRIRLNRKGGRKAAAQARELLEDVLREFPFVGAVDLSVALAGILTAVMRPLLPSAPLIGADAATPGTGKTTLMYVCVLIALGAPIPAITISGSNDEEVENRLGALLLSGVGAMNLDNLSRPLQSDLLCQLLTASSIRLRVLGASRAPEVSTGVFITATGNNLVLVGDLSRRALVCRLDAQCERPDQRQFSRRIGDYVLAQRKALVEAALTIVANYADAGRPDVGTAPFGSFEMWSETVRNALIWSGAADPCESRTRIEDADPIRGELSDLLPLWFERWGAQTLQVRNILESATLSHNEEIREVLLTIAANRRDPRQIDPRRLAHWLRRYRGRVVDGLRLDTDGTSGHRAWWRVSKI